MADDKDIAIRIEGVSKDFRLPHEKSKSLKGAFLSRFRGKNYEVQHALHDISFEIKKGEFFGIIGRNGSGKSTLLKCIAGVYVPTKGKIQINGSLVPFIELGVGFNPDLSGRDNVFLNGALLGFSRKRMEAMYDDIVGFAELEQFMDQKLRNYSSGMQVRLAFSIAIRAKGDILLLDEVLAVGDTNFQKKCIEIFHQLKKQGKTIVLVSHDTVQIERFCDRVAVIDKSRLIQVGPASKAIAVYDELNEGKVPHQSGSRELKITESEEAQLASGYKQTSMTIKARDQEIVIELPFVLRKDLPRDVSAAITLEDENSHTIYSYATEQYNVTPEFGGGGKKLMTFTIANVFPGGRYYVDAGIFSKDRAVTYIKLDNMASVKCEGFTGKEWLIRSPTRLDIK